VLNEDGEQEYRESGPAVPASLDKLSGTHQELCRPLRVDDDLYWRPSAQRGLMHG
jgi:hypothetical protein